jgi:LAO/AO transport system kinase
LSAALRSLGSRSTKLVAVSSLSPPTGIAELAEALEERRTSTDIAARRLAARRAGALTEFTLEHGEHGLRELGGRAAAVRLLEDQDPGLQTPDLLACLQAALG